MKRKGSIKGGEEAIFFFFKQKTAYEIYQCDWSSDVCSSDLMEMMDASVTYLVQQMGAYESHLPDLAAIR